MEGRQLRAVRVAVALGLVLAAACGSGSGEDRLTLDEIVTGPSDEVFAAREEQAEEHRRACMAEAGFEYAPHPQPRFTVNSGRARSLGALITAEDRAFVEANGYGLIAALIEENEHFLTDPNFEIRNRLSMGEAQAYGEAHADCALEARNASGFDEAYVDLALQVNALIPELETEILSDPRLAEATERWAACMGERGHSFRRLSDPRDTVASWYEDIDSADLDYERLAADEVALAVDDLDCRAGSGVDEVLPEVIEEAEAGFMERHGDLLEQYHAIRTGS